MVLSLTHCWSWDVIWWDTLAENHCSVPLTSCSHGMTWDNCGTKSLHCHSHSVSHKMRCDGKSTVLSLTICWSMVCNVIRLLGRKSIHYHSLPWAGHGMRLPGKRLLYSHSHPVGHEMRLAGKGLLYCHSHPVGHGMRNDERDYGLPLTPCWSWHEK